MNGKSKKEMYDEIDRFLGMTDKYSRKTVWKTKIFFLLFGLGFAVFCWYGMQHTTEHKIHAAVLMVASLLGGVVSFLTFGNKPFKAMEDFKKLIDTDGVEKVYFDMKISRRVGSCEIYLGDEYVFDMSGELFRRSDIQDIDVCVIPMKTGYDYYAQIRRADGTSVLLKRLSARSEEKRAQQFGEIKKYFPEFK